MSNYLHTLKRQTYCKLIQSLQIDIEFHKNRILHLFISFAIDFKGLLQHKTNLNRSISFWSMHYSNIFQCYGIGADETLCWWCRKKSVYLIQILKLTNIIFVKHKMHPFNIKALLLIIVRTVIIPLGNWGKINYRRYKCLIVQTLWDKRFEATFSPFSKILK